MLVGGSGSSLLPRRGKPKAAPVGAPARARSGRRNRTSKPTVAIRTAGPKNAQRHSEKKEALEDFEDSQREIHSSPTRLGPELRCLGAHLSRTRWLSLWRICISGLYAFNLGMTGPAMYVTDQVNIVTDILHR